MTNGELAVIIATLAGPVLAVQAQKWVERWRATDARRESVFQSLMATRQARTAPDHVRALNTIDLAFYGTRAFGRRFQSTRTAAVTTTWKEYQRHLSVDQSAYSADQKSQWGAAANELFLNLLEALALATRYKFDRTDLRTSSYSPEAHAIIEAETHLLRRAAIDVLSGERPLKVRLDAEQANAQREFQSAILSRMPSGPRHVPAAREPRVEATGGESGASR